jgi:monoamine oxidase
MFQTQKLSRRRFLQVAGLAAGAVGLRQVMRSLGVTPASPYRGHFALPGTGEGTRVIILGAGLAGLVTAYEMSRAGYECHVLEARERSGGRCWTVRAGSITEEDEGQQESQFDPGLFFNAGPDRIPQEHRAVLSYCRQLGVPMRAFVGLNAAAYYYHENGGPLSGERIRLRQAWTDLNGHTTALLAAAVAADPGSLQLSQEDGELLLEYLESYGNLEEAAEAEHPQENGDDEPRGARPETRLRYEGAGQAGYVTPPGAFDQEGEPLAPLPLTALLEAEYWRHFPFEWAYHQQSALLHPDGGMDRIVHAFEQHVGHLIRLEAEVQEIRRTAAGVSVVYQDRRTGQGHEISGDYCVCTLPLPVLAQLVTDFPAEVQRAVAEVAYLPAVKVGLQFARRFWEDEEHIYGGGSYTNLDIGQIWYPSWGYHSAKGIVDGAHAYGTAAEALGNLAPPARVEAALGQGARLHPQYNEAFETAFAVAWQHDPYSRGAWAAYTAEQRANLYPVLNRFDDFIYLAGDHMSHLSGWLEGAVLSAHHVSERIHEQVRRLRGRD